MPCANSLGWLSRTSATPSPTITPPSGCLLYTSDAADDPPCVDLGVRRIIKKKNNTAFVYSAIASTYHATNPPFL